MTISGRGLSRGRATAIHNNGEHLTARSRPSSTRSRRKRRRAPTVANFRPGHGVRGDRATTYLWVVDETARSGIRIPAVSCCEQVRDAGRRGLEVMW